MVAERRANVILSHPDEGIRGMGRQQGSPEDRGPSPRPLPEESVRYSDVTAQPTGTAQPPAVAQEVDQERPAYAFWVVVAALTLASIVFVIIMLAFRNVFTEAALVTTSLSTLFGIFGTVVGAYFGIKSSSDTFDKSRKDVAEANEKASRALAALPSDEGKKVLGIRP
jgi:hypothetical protein